MVYSDIEVKHIFFSDLKNQNIEIPDIQRIIDNNKVNEIVEFQDKCIVNDENFKFELGILQVCILQNKYYLIDGQHRYKAMMKIFEKYKINFKCFVQYITVDSYEELKECFKLINQNTELPDIEFDNNEPKDIATVICNHFQNKYNKKIWSKGNTKPKRPYISFKHFQEAVVFLIKQLPNNNNNTEQIIDIIENKNNDISNFERDAFKKDITDSMYNTAKENNFYLGLYKYNNEEGYYFEWICDIIKNKTGKELKPKKTTKQKKHVPKVLKSKVWNIYIGTKYGECKCIVCNNNTITQNNNEAGHIKSEKDGGEMNEDNLIPICGECNKSMGSKHMREFISETFPNNLKTFDKALKDKKIPINNNDNKSKKILGIF